MLLKNSDEFFKVMVLCGFEFRVVHEIFLKGDYIKAATIIQNFNSQVFCVPFLRDGQFNLLIFDTKQKLREVNLSLKLNLS